MTFSFCWKSTGLGLGLGSEVWNDVSTASHRGLLCAATPLSQAERKFASGTGYNGKRVIVVKVGALNHLHSDSVGFIEFEHPKAFLFSESPCHSLVAPQREARAVVDVHHCCQVAADRKVGSSLLPWRTGLSMPWRWSWLVCFAMMLCVCLIYVVLSMEFQWAYRIPQYSTQCESIQFFTILYYTSSFSFSSFRWSIIWNQLFRASFHPTPRYPGPFATSSNK